ncbi:MAG: hypothetical protein HKN82_18000 [Akkermansiaceae bacterium]|nr:hypothetical protein [Akkermansiaceae bacterium]NNM29368.1 hypothetical protein [Akkermansiaceae bacterium]
MESNFGTICRFLASFPGPVRSRGEEEVPAELDDLIRRFVAGGLSDDELLALYRELRGNEYAMEMLATLLNGE